MSNDQTTPPTLPSRMRQRPQRQVVVDPETPPPPPPPPEGFDIGEDERFERGAGNPLPGAVPERIRILARAMGTAAHHSEVVKYLAPFIYRQATDVEIAEAFDISVRSVNRWRHRFKDAIRSRFAEKDIIDHWAEAKGRVSLIQSVLLRDMEATETVAGETPGDRIRLRAGVIKAIIETEKMNLLIDTGYGRGDAAWLEANRTKQAALGGGEARPVDLVLEGVRSFMHRMADIAMSRDPEEGDEAHTIDITPTRAPTK